MILFLWVQYLLLVGGLFLYWGLIVWVYDLAYVTAVGVVIVVRFVYIVIFCILYFVNCMRGMLYCISIIINIMGIRYRFRCKIIIINLPIILQHLP